jgi:hypothetical protein
VRRERCRQPPRLAQPLEAVARALDVAREHRRAIHEVQGRCEHVDRSGRSDETLHARNRRCGGVGIVGLELGVALEQEQRREVCGRRIVAGRERVGLGCERSEPAHVGVHRGHAQRERRHARALGDALERARERLGAHSETLHERMMGRELVHEQELGDHTRLGRRVVEPRVRGRDPLGGADPACDLVYGLARAQQPGAARERAFGVAGALERLEGRREQLAPAWRPQREATAPEPVREPRLARARDRRELLDPPHHDRVPAVRRQFARALSHDTGEAAPVLVSHQQRRRGLPLARVLERGRRRRPDRPQFVRVEFVAVCRSRKSRNSG